MKTAGRCYKLTAVCLGLLCVLLLTAITLLWIKLSAERDQLQTRNTNLTLERDQLQSSYTNLTVERDQLQTSYINLAKERDQLQTRYTSLTKERDQLQTSYTSLTKERDQDQLNTSNTNLAKERDQLQTSYTNLAKERDQLHTSNTNLAKERDQLQTSYTNLAKERDRLQTIIHVCVLSVDKAIKEGWRLNTKAYYISTERKTWTESRQDCINRGAHLVIINSREEQNFAKSLRGDQKAWIGLNDRDTENTWRWVDYSALSTGFWRPGEPNSNAGDEDCVITGEASDPVMNWADYPCNDNFVWICEKQI
ncbi:uncharacterized protein [Salminus brasiliensis]|uniref:uncharacterized protein n=1 Tax=Salminus brasiliensis TaxID=930266 RepID=UPI003B82E4B2